MKAPVALSDLRVFGDHQTGADKRSAVTNARLMDRHSSDVDFVADQNFLLNRTGLDQARRPELLCPPHEFRDHLLTRRIERDGRERHIARRLPQTTPAWIIRQVLK